MVFEGIKVSRPSSTDLLQRPPFVILPNTPSPGVRQPTLIATLRLMTSPPIRAAKVHSLKRAPADFSGSDGIVTAFKLCSALGEVIDTTSTRFSDMCGLALMHWFQKHRVFLVLDESLGRGFKDHLHFFFSHVRTLDVLDEDVSTISCALFLSHERRLVDQVFPLFSGTKTGQFFTPFISAQ